MKRLFTNYPGILDSLHMLGLKKGEIASQKHFNVYRCKERVPHGIRVYSLAHLDPTFGFTDQIMKAAGVEEVLPVKSANPYNHAYTLILKMLRAGRCLRLHDLRHARFNGVAAGINLWLAQRKVKEE